MTWFKQTPATPAHCPRCHADTLTAWDAGLHAAVDATPLSGSQAEIAALLKNLLTYTRTPSGFLHQRDPGHIAAPVPPGATIHAQHACTRPQQLTIDDMIGTQ